MDLGNLNFDIVSDFDIRISYFASLGIFTLVESALQINLFMQNKAKFRKSQMDVSPVYTKDYANETLGKRGKNKPNSNPIQTQTKPIKANIMPKQTQYKAKQTQFLMILAYFSSRAKKCCCRVNPHASRRAGTVARIKIVTALLTLLCIDGTLSPLKLKEADFWNYPCQ